MSVRCRLVFPDVAATHAFARRLAGLLRPGDVVALSGPLGSGKTEIARAVIQARAGAAIEVPSPSFTLVQDYSLPGLLIRHVDLYRVEDPGELVELGLDEPGAEDVLLIEWPERAGEALPADRLDVVLDHGERPETRTATVQGGPSWIGRLPALLDD